MKLSRVAGAASLAVAVAAALAPAATASPRLGIFPPGPAAAARPTAAPGPSAEKAAGERAPARSTTPHVIVASTGDFGYTAALFPANLTSVTAAGGTQLSRANNARGWTEQVSNNYFGASGSGCSAYALISIRDICELFGLGRTAAS